MKPISVLIAGLLVAGCAGMNTKPNPEERFLFLDFGKVWAEVEYESGDVCYQMVEAARQRGEHVKSKCAAPSRPVMASTSFSMQSSRGQFTMHTSSMETCTAVRKMMTRFTEVFSDADTAALTGEKGPSNITPCK